MCALTANVASSVAQSVSMLEECLWAIEEKVPTLADVRRRHVEFLRRWRTFRDDAAHLAERYLRDPVAPAHSCQNGLTGDSIVVGYDADLEALRTGQDIGSLADACQGSANILRDLEARAKEETLYVQSFCDRLNEAQESGYLTRFLATARYYGTAPDSRNITTR